MSLTVQDLLNIVDAEDSFLTKLFGCYSLVTTGRRRCQRHTTLTVKAVRWSNAVAAAAAVVSTAASLVALDALYYVDVPYVRLTLS